MCLGAIYNAHIDEIIFSSLNHKEGAFTKFNVDSSLFKIEYVLCSIQFNNMHS